MMGHDIFDSVAEKLTGGRWHNAKNDSGSKSGQVMKNDGAELRVTDLK